MNAPLGLGYNTIEIQEDNIAYVVYFVWQPFIIDKMQSYNTI